MRLHRTRRRLSLLALVLVASAGMAEDREAFFEQRIRPVLVERCYTCHSAVADPLKGALRLDSAAALAAGGASGVPAVVPGAPEASRLIEAIRYGNSDLQMPPKEALPENVVADFERWIREGAIFPASAAPIDLMAKARTHWAFHPPAPQSLPAVQDAAWPRTAVDHFVLAALEAKGLKPAPEADRRTMIRRLSFDLTGLPPSVEAVEAFAADTAPDAYEKLVEQLLAAPQYGERWARHWLDVARYADTKGYVYGGREEVNFTHSHVYRDWVVDAFNRDRPYDEFVRLQLAADALTGDDTREDLAAMGFLTLGQRFLGVVPDIVDDRIDTVTRGLMGLTVSCARCHDHKFDPVPTKDYYALYGVFSASSERTLPLRPADLEDAHFAAFNEERAKRQAKLESTFAERSRTLEERLRTQVDRYLAAVPTANTLPTDDFYQILNAEDLNPTMVRRWAAYIARQGEDDPIFGLWNRFSALPPGQVAAHARTVLETLVNPAPGALVLAAAPTMPPVNDLIHAALTATPPQTIEDVAARYGVVFKQVFDAWVAQVQAAEAAGQPAPIALPDPDQEAIRQALFAPGSPVLVPEGAIVDLEWMFDEPTRVELGTLNAEIERWIITAESAPDYATILVDKPERPLPRVFKRGNPASPGEEVPRQFLELLSGPSRQPFAEGSGRRELAEAIASASNPLTARVFVNRVWGWHFGRGLVATTSDFGTRAAVPSHPELLDWLAIHFIEQGWSLKQLHRLIVNSATYRQTSTLPAEDPRVVHAMEVDPENTLLWKFNRRRLDFESLRDALLHSSGELDLALGGRPVDLTAQPFTARRTIYGRVDRQFLPAVLRVFDFPNPDMHSPGRIDTVVPQQALFLMNNPFVQSQARALAARTATGETAQRVDALYRHAYQRTATSEQASRALDFLREAETTTPPTPPVTPPPAWSYGYGKFDEGTGKMAGFTPLPHFTGSAWQGGTAWPDGALGWAQLTADGGHPGNDLDHAVVRRWSAPVAGSVSIRGRIQHDRPESDGILARVSSSRHGLLGAWPVHHREADANVYGIVVETGDTIDFIVDIRAELNNDQYRWTPEVVIEAAPEAEARTTWNAAVEFAGPYTVPPVPLSPWEKLAQVLLVSNEFLFVD